VKLDRRLPWVLGRLSSLYAVNWCRLLKLCQAKAIHLWVSDQLISPSVLLLLAMQHPGLQRRSGAWGIPKGVVCSCHAVLCAQLLVLLRAIGQPLLLHHGRWREADVVQLWAFHPEHSITTASRRS
jgi:hypothetical protein